MTIRGGGFQAPLGYARGHGRADGSRTGAAMRDVARRHAVGVGMRGIGLGGASNRLCTSTGATIAQALIGTAGGITQAFATSSSDPMRRVGDNENLDDFEAALSQAEAGDRSIQRTQRAGQALSVVADQWGRACTQAQQGDPMAAYAQQQAAFAQYTEQMRTAGSLQMPEAEILGVPKTTFYIGAGAVALLAAALLLR